MLYYLGGCHGDSWLVETTRSKRVMNEKKKPCRDKNEQHTHARTGNANQYAHWSVKEKFKRCQQCLADKQQMPPAKESTEEEVQRIRRTYHQPTNQK